MFGWRRFFMMAISLLISLVTFMFHLCVDLQRVTRREMVRARRGQRLTSR
jgi:hypothetical protein